MVKVARTYTQQEFIEESVHMKMTAKAIDGARPIEVTREADGRNVVSLPLPEKLRIAAFFLGHKSDFLETILTFKFANLQARYRVIGVNDDGTVLIGELIQQNEKRLAPYIPVDPETMPKLS
jgi:hypothetical protein